jgi:hypothetical protein
MCLATGVMPLDQGRQGYRLFTDMLDGRVRSVSWELRAGTNAEGPVFSLCSGELLVVGFRDGAAVNGKKMYPLVRRQPWFTSWKTTLCYCVAYDPARQEPGRLGARILVEATSGLAVDLDGSFSDDQAGRAGGPPIRRDWHVDQDVSIASWNTKRAPILARAGDWAVVRAPGRRFPGIHVQADTLAALRAQSSPAGQALRHDSADLRAFDGSQSRTSRLYSRRQPVRRRAGRRRRAVLLDDPDPMIRANQGEAATPREGGRLVGHRRPVATPARRW